MPYFGIVKHFHITIYLVNRLILRSELVSNDILSKIFFCVCRYLCIVARICMKLVFTENTALGDKVN